MSSTNSYHSSAMPGIYNKKFLVIMIIVVVALVSDTIFIRINDLVAVQLSSIWRIFLFGVISFFLIIGQFFILKRVKFRSEGIQESVLHIHTLLKIVTILQLIQAIALAAVIFQIIFASAYNTLLIFIITTLSYSLGILILILLVQRFLSWFKARRNYEILLYGMASATLAVSIMFALGSLELTLVRAPNVVPEHLGTTHMLLSTGSHVFISRFMYNLFSIISFVTAWAATFMMLRHYSRKMGKVRNYIILSSPLAVFLSQFIIPLNVLYPILNLDPVVFAFALTLIFNLSKIAGGILFGATFWIISRSLGQNNILKDYLVIAGLGFLLLFVSNSLIPAGISYPPFGIAAIMFIGFSCFLVLEGIYSSAITIAENISLRQSIRRLATKEHKLLEGMGMAQMEEKIQKKVINVIKEQQNESTHSTMKDEDIKAYIAEVIKEINTTRNNNVRTDERDTEP